MSNWYIDLPSEHAVLWWDGHFLMISFNSSQFSYFRMVVILCRLFLLMFKSRFNVSINAKSLPNYQTIFYDDYDNDNSICCIEQVFIVLMQLQLSRQFDAMLMLMIMCLMIIVCSCWICIHLYLLFCSLAHEKPWIHFFCWEFYELMRFKLSRWLKVICVFLNFYHIFQLHLFNFQHSFLKKERYKERKE